MHNFIQVALMALVVGFPASVSAQSNSSEYANKLASQSSYDFYSGGGYLNANEQGRVQGNVLQKTDSSIHYDCDTLKKVVFEAAHHFIKIGSNHHDMELADPEYCTVSQGKPGTMFANLISINFYTGPLNYKNAVIDNNSTVSRKVQLFPHKGQLFWNVYLQDGATINMFCFDAQGEYVNSKGCSSL